ncbi:MAG: porin, partial [Candidatus Limisoma sp.]
MRIEAKEKLLIVAVFLITGFTNAMAQDDTDDRLSVVERKVEQMAKQSEYLPKLHGILRGKYEYEPDLGASRFEVRNARLSVNGKLVGRSEYKMEVDLCDESEIKMKDAWVRLNPYKTLRFTIGQQRMPFTIDAHRNPSA